MHTQLVPPGLEFEILSIVRRSAIVTKQEGMTSKVFVRYAHHINISQLRAIITDLRKPGSGLKRTRT